MIRSFVGLALPDPIADRMTAAQAGLPAGRPVARENLHITLVFAGEHPEPVVEDLHFALERIRAPGLTLRIAGTSLFSGSGPRALAADVTPAPALTHLRSKVTRAVQEAGIETDRKRYHPHVTIARFGPMSAEDRLAVEGFAGRSMNLVAGPFEIDRFCLFESRLGKAGASYSVLAEYPLGPAGEG